MNASPVALVTRLALAYFAAVFAIGFLLGTLRTLWIERWVGARAAELAEMPFMIAASYLVARALVDRHAAVGIRGAALVGLAALALLLGAELAVVAFVREQSLVDYVESRDPVSGSAYVLALLLFAAFPALVAHRRARRV